MTCTDDDIGHAVQAVEADRTAKLAAGHAVHFVPPSVALILPRPQIEQARAPPSLAYRPGAQSLHGDPSLAYRPKSQIVHLPLLPPAGGSLPSRHCCSGIVISWIKDRHTLRGKSMEKSRVALEPTFANI